MRALAVWLMTMAVAATTARADEPAPPAPPADAEAPPEVGQLVVDGAPLRFDCAPFGGGEDVVIVATPLGAGREAIAPFVDGLRARRNIHAVEVALAADRDAAAQQLARAVDSVRAQVTDGHLPCRYAPSQAHLERVIAVGSAAQAVEICDLYTRITLVDPQLSAADADRFATCAERSAPVNAVVSSCPAAQDAAAPLIAAYRRLRPIMRPYVARAAGCVDGVGDAERTAVADLLDSPPLDTVDLVTDGLPPPPTPRHTAVAVSTIAGVSISGHPVLALRAEMIGLRRGFRSVGLGGHVWYGNAIGETIELGGAGSVGPPMIGLGADAVLPLKGGTHQPGDYDGALVLQPSLGAYVGQGGVRLGAGAFLGLRMDHTAIYGSEFPFGVRVDAWYRPETRKTDVSVSVSADGIGIIVVAAVVAAWAVYASSGSD